MTGLIIGLLALATLTLLVKVRLQQRSLRDLRDALIDRRAFLPEEGSAAHGTVIREIAREHNRLLGEWKEAVSRQSGWSRQLEATFGSMIEAVLIIDESDHIRLMNNAFRSMFPRLPTQQPLRLASVLGHSEVIHYISQVRAGASPGRIEVEYHDGQEMRWLQFTATLIPAPDDAAGHWLLMVLHEVTRQRQLENVRKEFVANVSHELRTPLSVIKGYVETLVDSHPAMEPADRERFLRTIQRHTERLIRILEDLLILSRLESRNPGLQRERLDLRALALQLAEDYRARLLATGHQLAVTSPENLPPVEADRLKLSQVFENLVDNAIKYTPPKSLITINMSVASDALEVRVADNGPGIPPAELTRIFERFYRVDKGRSRETGGTGLGLSIVKHIIQLHGGRVWAESGVGQGTTIVFTLPLPVGG